MVHYNSIKISNLRCVKKKRAPVYDMNTKAVRGMIHSGLSVTGIQKITTSLRGTTSQCKNIEKEGKRNGSGNRKNVLKNLVWMQLNWTRIYVV